MSSLTTLKKSKKENNRKSGAGAAHKQALRDEAKTRQEAYNKLSTTDKMQRGFDRGMGHRERTKLILRAKKEGLLLSDYFKEKLNL
jgi:hypothetical protein